MYTYTAGGTGLDAAMPPWVREGGLEAWIQRMMDPSVRARVAKEMDDPHPGYENLYLHAGAEGMILAAFKSDKLKPLTGKTLAEVARIRHTSPEETAMDLCFDLGVAASCTIGSLLIYTSPGCQRRRCVACAARRPLS
ncbi:MAG: aminoacylase [Gammaproteobacteria bacterium]|nr:aminoacylase [Gammaproteobacteria bacterium]